MLGTLGAGSAAAILPKLSYGVAPNLNPNVVVVGGGPGGAAAAKYTKIWGGGDNINVTLVTPSRDYFTCVQSNLVVAGAQGVNSITRSLNTLESRYGVTIQDGSVTAIDPVLKTVRVGSSDLPYDYLILSPGVVPIPDSIPGDSGFSLSYWEGSKAKDLNDLLKRPSRGGAMPDRGTFVMHITKGTIKGGLAPYGRFSVVFDALQARGCHVIVLDEHTDIPSQKSDFIAALNGFNSFNVPGTNDFKGVPTATGAVIDYYAGVKLDSVDRIAKKLSVSRIPPGSPTLPLLPIAIRDGVPFHVANVIPPQKANLGFPTALPFWQGATSLRSKPKLLSQLSQAIQGFISSVTRHLSLYPQHRQPFCQRAQTSQPIKPRSSPASLPAKLPVYRWKHRWRCPPFSLTPFGRPVVVRKRRSMPTPVFSLMGQAGWRAPPSRVSGALLPLCYRPISPRIITRTV